MDVNDKLPEWASDESRKLQATYLDARKTAKDLDRKASAILSKLKNADLTTVEIPAPEARLQPLLRCLKADLETLHAKGPLMDSVYRDSETERRRIGGIIKTLSQELRQLLNANGWTREFAPDVDQKYGLAFILSNSRIQELSAQQGGISATQLLLTQDIAKAPGKIEHVQKRIAEVEAEIRGLFAFNK